jgi:hypothetical protein
MTLLGTTVAPSRVFCPMATSSQVHLMVDVLVSGAVVHVGHHLIPGPATVEAALEEAGGLVRRPQMWAAGPITIRRRRASRKVDVWRFNLNDPEPQAWRKFELQSGDLVIFAWHIEGLQPEQSRDGLDEK